MAVLYASMWRVALCYSWKCMPSMNSFHYFKIKFSVCFYLTRRDQVLVAQAIRKYMNQYSIPQREVVEKTNLNQSHLSQHFTHGVTMKASKRIKLYHWFEDDQKQRTGSM